MEYDVAIALAKWAITSKEISQKGGFVFNLLYKPKDEEEEEYLKNLRFEFSKLLKDMNECATIFNEAYERIKTQS